MAQDIAVLGIEVRTSGVQQANRDLQNLTQQGGRAETAVQGLERRMSGLKAVFAGVGFAAVARQVISTADAMTNLDSRLKLVTKSSHELTQVQNALFAQSQASQTSLRANADLYISLARSTQDLGISQDRLLSVTDGIGKALAVSGTSAAAAAGGLLQLSQALQSGVLRGEEFNSVSEQIPRLAQAIADGMGIARSELRQFANDGRLTTDVVLPALEKGLASVQREFGSLTPTVGRATTALGNAFDKLVNDADKSSGVTRSIASGITALSENLDSVVNVLGVAVVAAFGRYTGAALSSVAATVQRVNADRAAAVSAAAAAAATARAAAAEQQSAVIAQTTARAKVASTAEEIAADKARAASAAATAQAEIAARRGQFVAVAQIIRQEIAVEQTRLAAQMNDTGRAARLQQLAALSLQLAAAEKAAAAQSVAASAQKASAEAAAATAATAASAKIIAAREAETVATTAAAAATLRARQTTAAAEVAMTGLSRAAGIARGALALLGGPIGAITTLLTAGAVAWAVWGKGAETAAQKAEKSINLALDRVRAMKEEMKFGSGDVGTLNKALEDIDARMQLLNQSRSAGAQSEVAKLLKQRTEIEGALRQAETGGLTAAQQTNAKYAAYLQERRSNAQKLKDDLAEEVVAFKAATAGFKEGSAEYEKAVAAHQVKLAEIREKHTKKVPKGPKAPKEDLNAGFDTAAAQAFSSAINAIASAQNEAERSGLNLNAAQSVLYDLMKSPEWERMPEAWRQVVIEQTAAATAADGLAVAQRKQTEAMEEGRAITEQMRTPIESLGVTVQRLNELLDLGAIDWETYSRAVFDAQDRFDALSKKAEETSDKMSEFAKNFARSAQSTISDVLFDGANGKIDNLADRFGQAVQRMLADAAAARLMENLFGESFGKTGAVDAGSWIGKAASGIGSAASWISMLFSANGNAFAGSGAVQKFAAGGAFGNGEVLTRPTAFRFAQGGAFRNGIAGEAGPEGALPLKRMSNGKLGVYADGGGGGGSTVINVTVQGGSAPDVRRAAGQGAREALSVMGGAQRYS